MDDDDGVNGAENQRRRFLRSFGAFSTLGLASRLTRGPFITDASAQPATDYKALVCVFMYGGNDGNNTVLPIDDEGYRRYATARPATSGINLPRASLLPIQPGNVDVPFGLHPALSELQSLFLQRKLAIVANVGTLAQPTTQADYNAGQRPAALYAHADQQDQWQSAVYTEPSTTGWGGRLADRLGPYNAATSFPALTSFDGRVLFVAGVSGGAITIYPPSSFAPAPVAANDADALRATPRRPLVQSAFVSADDGLSARTVRLLRVVGPIVNNGNAKSAPYFASLTSDVASQLLLVAKMIEGRASLGLKRQIFFVQLGSFDTHNDQLRRQEKLLGDLSAALGAFYSATIALGVSTQVTTFTLSEFGRTLLPNLGGGSDHGWGSHHFIIGDAVNGGALYGQYPALSPGSPNDAGQLGRWIPTTAVDQYGATLANWFGAAPADMNSIFPTLEKFSSADLGFLARERRNPGTR